MPSKPNTTGSKPGTFGEFGCFSFYVTKNVVTGEGGMILARRRAHQQGQDPGPSRLARDAWRRFSDDGYKHYYVTECGFKYNMMDIQAALGIHQLAGVERQLVARQAIWKPIRMLSRTCRFPSGRSGIGNSACPSPLHFADR